MKIHSGISLSLSFFLILFTGCTRTEKSYDEQGNLRSEISYRGDQIHGKAAWYYYNGQAQQEFNYHKGLLDGPARRWYFDGRLESETHYRDGRKYGLERAWDEFGTLSLKQHWVKDTLHGEYVEYHPNGRVRVRGKYEKGLFDSTWLYQNPAGLMVGKGIFTQGSGDLWSFYLDGKSRRLVPYQQNEKHGWEIWMDRQGDTLRRREYVQGVLIQEEILKAGGESEEETEPKHNNLYSSDMYE
jgi:antitoxin component YwqK of YwqJK toxin-antitoxin module